MDVPGWEGDAVSSWLDDGAAEVDKDSEGVAAPDPLCVGLPVPPSDVLEVAESDGVIDGESAALLVGVTVTDKEGMSEALPVSAWLGVPDCVGTGDWLCDDSAVVASEGLGDGDVVAPCETELVLEDVTSKDVPATVGVPEVEAVEVAVGEYVVEGVSAAEAVPDGVAP